MLPEELIFLLTETRRLPVIYRFFTAVPVRELSYCKVKPSGIHGTDVLQVRPFYKNISRCIPVS